MGILEKLGFGRKDNVWERWVELMDFGNRSKAGPTVSKENIWRVSTALACMGVRARGVAQVPFKLFQETQKDGLRSIQPARQHPLFDKLAARPNAWQTSFEFREQLELHLCLGNAFVFLNFYRNKVEEMFLLCNVRAVQQEDRSTRYFVRGNGGEEREIPAQNIWHLRGLSWDGFLGLDTLNIAKEALGLSMALEQSAADLHANGVRPSGTYSVEGNLSPEQHAKLSAWLKREATFNRHAPMVLDRAAKWLSTAMTSVDAQHKEMRNLQIEEVCRFFNVLPIMIGHTSDKASTYASAEAMFTAHKVHTMAPEYERIQQSADVNLLTDAERAAGYYFKFVVNALNWANLKDQAEYFAKALGSGGSPAWHTQDEVRALLEYDPMGGEASKLPPLINKAPPPAPAPAA